MRAAARWGLPPGGLLVPHGKPPRTHWTPRDGLLALGLQELEDSLHSCGQPVWESFAVDGPPYRIEDEVCRACAALEAANERPKGDVQVEKGLIRHAVPIRGLRANQIAAPDMNALLGGALDED